MKTIVTFLAGWGVLAATAASAQSPVSLTLAEAQALALENAYAVQYARLDQEKASRDVKELTATGLPQLNLIADYSQYIDIPTQVVPADAFGFPDYLTEFLGGVAQSTGVPLNAPAPDPDGLSELQFGNEHTANVGIQASQLIFNGSYFVGLQASRLYADSRVQAIERTADEVRKAVAEAYHGVTAAGANAEMLGRMQQAIADQLEETTALKDAGFLDATAVDQLTLALRDLEQQTDYARTQEKLLRAVLAFQIGLNPVTEITLKEDLAALEAQASGADLLSREFNPLALPGLREQQAFVDLAGLDVKNQKAAGLPQVAAFYNFQQNAQRSAWDFFDPDGAWYDVQLWGVNFSMPLWTSLGGKQRVEKAQIEHDRARIGYEQMERAASLEFLSAQAEFTNAVAQLENRRESLALAQRIHDRVEIGQREGVNTSFELADARNRLIEAEGSLIGAQLTALNARVRLQAALSDFE
jgi:outer membrane protein TolC